MTDCPRIDGFCPTAPGSAARILGVWFVCLLLATTGCDARDAISFNAEPVAEGVTLYRPSDGGPNTTVVTRADGLLLIDAQPDQVRARALRRSIRATTRAPVRFVVVSHPHREAMGGVAVFEDALVIAADAALDALDDPAFDYDAELPDDDAGSDGRPGATIRVVGELVLDDPKLVVRIRPGPGGHSPGELIVSMHDDSVLHVGGLAFADGNPFGGTSSVTRWIVALNRMIRARPTTIVGTRGPALDLREFQQRRDALAWLRGQVQEAYFRGTAWELMAAEIAADPGATEYFDTGADPFFLEGLAAQAVEEQREQRRKRGVTD